MHEWNSPPGLTSSARNSIVQPCGAYQRASWAGSVQASNTSSRGASNVRVMRMSLSLRSGRCGDDAHGKSPELLVGRARGTDGFGSYCCRFHAVLAHRFRVVFPGKPVDWRGEEPVSPDTFFSFDVIPFSVMPYSDLCRIDLQRSIASSVASVVRHGRSDIRRSLQSTATIENASSERRKVQHSASDRPRERPVSERPTTEALARRNLLNDRLVIIPITAVRPPDPLTSCAAHWTQPGASQSLRPGHPH